MTTPLLPLALLPTVSLGVVKPLSVSIPKVTVPSALLVATVRPFSPLSVRVLTVLVFVASSLPTVMALVPSSSPFLTLKVCRAVLAVPLASLILVCSSVLASSNAFLLMASVSCIASPTLEMALLPALMPSLVRWGLLSSMPLLPLAKPILSVVRRVVPTVTLSLAVRF